jgi:malate dehydrogenase (quinone)
MLNLMQRCFEEAGTAAWQTKLKAMIPSFGESLAKDESLSNQVIPRTTRVLQLSGEGSVL